MTDWFTQHEDGGFRSHSQMKTEQEHIHELLDAISEAHAIALKPPGHPTRPGRPAPLILALQTQLQRAVAETVLLGFYRDRQRWMQIATVLDEAARRHIAPRERRALAAQLTALHAEIQSFTDRRTEADILDLMQQLAQAQHEVEVLQARLNEATALKSAPKRRANYRACRTRRL